MVAACVLKIKVVGVRWDGGRGPHDPFVGQASQVFGCGGRGGRGPHAKQLPPTVGRVAFEPPAIEGVQASEVFSALSDVACSLPLQVSLVGSTPAITRLFLLLLSRIIDPDKQ